MKLRWKLTVGMMVLVAGWAVWHSISVSNVKRRLEKTRTELRAQGFRVDYADFELSTSADVRSRAQALSKAGERQLGTRVELLSASIGYSNSAVVFWKQQPLVAQLSSNVWGEARERFDSSAEGVAHLAELAAARQAAASGPIRFEPTSLRGVRDSMWPHLPQLRGLELELQARTILALHDGDLNEAWTNLVTATRLVTAWTPEPASICQITRFALLAAAYDCTWEALQARSWSQSQLAQLQHEWESANFFSSVPETAAFTRATLSAAAQAERQQQPMPPMPTLSILEDPPAIWRTLGEHSRIINYRLNGTYEDEQAMLLNYRDREIELRRAVTCPTWQEMRSLPGVTNPPSFRSGRPTQFQGRGGGRGFGFGFQGRRGLLPRAADAEARRRILVTALALERYREQHGSYPKTLAALVPDKLKDVPLDFMDGKPLRYDLTEDGHFVLYSVGLDCVDNGGDMRHPETTAFQGPPGFEFDEGADVVWPRPLAEDEKTPPRSQGS
jgi:hypothetical protein